MNKIAAVIPAYNAENYIKNVINAVQRQNIDVIVVDDGSIDGTLAVIKKETPYFLTHSVNTGKGSALRDGFKYAVQRGYDLVITLDSDGQHNPDEIPNFIEKIQTDALGMVIGNRMHEPKGMPFQRVLVNKLYSKILTGMCKTDLPDPLCGYRIYRMELVKQLNLTANGYEVVIESILEAVGKGFKIGAIDIECIYGDQKSYIRPLRDAVRTFRLMFTRSKNQ
ncbi:MAG: glycosyltransferase family 2 protein [Candidatus Omnitrophica bacterium]|nr:glycosyltransferase family 2 protein [Candidatus Omnitrophota bacterium]